MYSVMTIVNTAVLYTWKMLRKSFESSHYTLRIYNCGVIGVLINFTVFVLQYIHLSDITPYTLNLHEVYAYHISIKLEKKKKKTVDDCSRRCYHCHQIPLFLLSQWW